MDPTNTARVALAICSPTATVRIAARVASSRVALTVEKEGGYAGPDGQVISLLQEFLNAKYSIDNAYRSFADRVRGPWRDALVDHWQEHAKEERSAAYDIAMKIVGLGADPMVTVTSVPQCPGNLDAFCQVLAKMELDTIENGRKLIAMSGDNAAMKVFAENLVLVDTKHLDDLRRMSQMSVG